MMSIPKASDLNAAAEPRTETQKKAGIGRILARQLILELILPLAGYYGLRSLGVSQWQALVIGSLLVAPWIIYGIVRNRRLEVAAVLTLSVLLSTAAMSLLTGDPRLLLVRDSWLGGLIGLWILATVPTRRPFIMLTSRAIVVAKVGEAGAKVWEDRWNHEADFRRHIRILSTIWGVVFVGDALVRVALAYTLPIDSVPGVSTVQWVVVLGCLIAFHIRYASRKGLRA